MLDKTFFKFLLGFTMILGTSLGILFIVGNYSLIAN